jgi:hypothetical protein
MALHQRSSASGDRTGQAPSTCTHGRDPADPAPEQWYSAIHGFNISPPLLTGEVVVGQARVLLTDSNDGLDRPGLLRSGRSGAAQRRRALQTSGPGLRSASFHADCSSPAEQRQQVCAAVPSDFRVTLAAEPSALRGNDRPAAEGRTPLGGRRPGQGRLRHQTHSRRYQQRA